MNFNAKTQEELETVVADAIARYEATPKEQRAALAIIIRVEVSPREMIWIPTLPHAIRVSIHGDGVAEVGYGSRDHRGRLDPGGKDFRVDVYGNVELTSFPTSGVVIRAHNTTHIDANGGTVHASEYARVDANDDTCVRASDNAVVEASGRATVVARDYARVHATDHASVSVHEMATANVNDNVKVTAYDDTTVHLWGESQVRAYGQAALHVRGRSVRVTAAPSVAVYLHTGTREAVEGGSVIDVPAPCDLDDVEVWLAQHGVPVEDGRATLFKALDSDLVAGKSYAKPVRYAVGAEVTCHDWRPNNVCGNGLHVSPAIYQAHGYQGGGHNARFLRVTVAVEDIRPINNGDDPKCKVPRLRVEAEVDAFGRELPAAPGSGV